MEKVASHPLGAGGDKEVWPVAPAAEKAAEVLAAQLVPLVFIQFRPQAVLMTDKWQAVVGDDSISLVLELETVVDIQVTVKAEAFAHETHFVYQVAPECHAISLHGVGVSALHFLMKMLEVVGGQPVGAEYAHGIISHLLADEFKNVTHYLGGTVQDNDVSTQTLLQTDVLSGGVPHVVVAVDHP